ncbi:MAG: hypothetical protein DVB31_06715, partial [Verrucomicrobia bacterium]
MQSLLAKLKAVALLTAGLAATDLGAQNLLTPGFLKVDYFDTIDQNGVDAVLTDPRYPSSPTSTEYWNVFGPYTTGNHHGEHFGARVTGFVIPPVTGDYKFYFRSDDAGQLSLSTDETEANLALICQQTGCCNAFTDSEGVLSSVPVNLIAGKKYFIEGILQENTGDDYIQVAWRTPGEDLNNIAGLQPISSAYLAAVAPTAGKSVAITQPPASVSRQQNDTATFTVDFTSTPTSPTAIAWFKNGIPIPGASGKTYTTPLLKASDDNAKIKVQVSVPGAVAVSAEATLTVTADTVLPTIASVRGSASFTQVTVAFS